MCVCALQRWLCGPCQDLVLREVLREAADKCSVATSKQSTRPHIPPRLLAHGPLPCPFVQLVAGGPSGTRSSSFQSAHQTRISNLRCTDCSTDQLGARPATPTSRSRCGSPRSDVQLCRFGQGLMGSSRAEIRCAWCLQVKDVRKGAMVVGSASVAIDAVSIFGCQCTPVVPSRFESGTVM